MSKLVELQELILNSGWKPYVLSTRLGHNQSTIYHWINEDYEPCCKDILKMSELLNVPVERLVRIFATRGEQ